MSIIENIHDIERDVGAKWEDICDGCALCCLHKLEDEDTGRIYYTSAACRMLEIHTCRCRAYKNRLELVEDCLVLTPESIAGRKWLPKTCAYRLIFENKPLEWWHHLISGSRETVHRAGISVRGWAISENDVDVSNLEAYIIDDKTV